MNLFLHSYLLSPTLKVFLFFIQKVGGEFAWIYYIRKFWLFLVHIFHQDDLVDYLK